MLHGSGKLTFGSTVWEKIHSIGFDRYYFTLWFVLTQRYRGGWVYVQKHSVVFYILDIIIVLRLWSVLLLGILHFNFCFGDGLFKNVFAVELHKRTVVKFFFNLVIRAGQRSDVCRLWFISLGNCVGENNRD